MYSANFHRLFWACVDIFKVLLVNPNQLKYLGRWFKSQICYHQPLKAELPWLTFGAIDWLSSTVTKKFSIFEWGSGGLTLFLAARMSQLISVEHDHAWYSQLSKRLKKNNLENKVNYLYAEPQQLAPSQINHCPSSSPKYNNFSFSRYCRTINSFANNYFDLIVIDGRARLNCLKLAVPKLKPGGYLVFDNSNTHKYHIGFKPLHNWYRQDFWGLGPFNSHPWQTTVWQKPNTRSKLPPV